MSNKLYLTLESGENKVERVVELGILMEETNINHIVADMMDSIDKVERESELIDEIKSITTNHD